jgi:lon-related putative ATP-dependent protease
MKGIIMTKSAKRSTSSKTQTPALPKPLGVREVYAPCDPTAFKFKSTKDMKSSHEIISQERAVRAINMGLGIRKPGYNIYMAGIQGTGKATIMKKFLEKWSSGAKAPNDWIYVNDFLSPETPKAIEMPQGEGRKIRKKMESFIKSLRREIPTALQSEDYENAVNAYMSAANERKSKLFGELERVARGMDFHIKTTKLGIQTIPVVEGKPLTEKEYGKLDDEQRTEIEGQRAKLEPEVLDFARKVRAIEQEAKEFIERLRGEVVMEVVKVHIEPLAMEYKHHKEIGAYLEEVKNHIQENLMDFAEQDGEEQSGEEAAEAAAEGRDRFRKYAINVFVDNTGTKGAPVIIESNPTYYNLFGRVEKNIEHGMYFTDFSMIKSGAIQRANGGYLVLNAVDVFRTQSIWDTLKRVLRHRQGFIEDMGEQYSLLPTSGLRPKPIPLDVKVILIGNNEIYHMLHNYDEEFHKIFKIKADFDYKMSRNKRNVDEYASFIATRSHVEKLLPFDRDGMAAIVEHGSRMVDDQRNLSAQFGELKDLTIEADFIAREDGAKSVGREHVEKALDEKYYRVNLVEEHLLDMVREGGSLLVVDGLEVGQVNALAVYDMGDYSFGHVSRVTSVTHLTDDGLVNVERSSKLSGSLHDKGMIILGNFLKSLLARKHGLGLSASVAFEQSYGMIDGDSATIAELMAILSSMSGIPLKQNFAMTGSMNQFGEVQPIGGVNEKIEGFFKTCELIGKPKKGCYTVLIPAQNVANLNLHRRVRQAIADGWFQVIAMKHAREAFEILSGVPLGIINNKDATFKEGSCLARIAARLDRIRKEAKEEAKADEKAKSKPKEDNGEKIKSRRKA